MFCAGRTDSGVHATGQVVHFSTNTYRSDIVWTRGVNANLPQDIAVRWIKHVPDIFHARFSAISRCYRYIIYNCHLRPASFRQGIKQCHYYHYLDEKRMHQAAQYLVGEHDFTTFQATHCQSATPWRHLTNIRVTRYSHYVLIDIKANAFLYNMVRNIVGSLTEVGNGRKSVDWACRRVFDLERALRNAPKPSVG